VKSFILTIDWQLTKVQPWGRICERFNKGWSQADLLSARRDYKNVAGPENRVPEQERDTGAGRGRDCYRSQRTASPVASPTPSGAHDRFVRRDLEAGVSDSRQKAWRAEMETSTKKTGFTGTTLCCARVVSQKPARDLQILQLPVQGTRTLAPCRKWGRLLKNARYLADGKHRRSAILGVRGRGSE